MTTYQYPAHDLHDRDALASATGSYWSETYEGGALVEDLAAAKGKLALQTHDNLRELVDAVSRHRLPVWHRERHQALRLRKSDRNRAPINRPHYDGEFDYTIDGINYGEELSVGQPAWPLPEGWHDFPILTNRLSAPSQTLVNGIDYRLAEGSIVFRVDPFELENTSRRTVFENGEAVDEELTLWAFDLQINRNHVFEQFGYLFNLDLPSSEPAKRLTNAVADSLVGGTASQSLDEALAALADLPAVAGDEVVQRLASEPDRRLVITDQNVYQYSAAASFVVQTGDRLEAGQSPVDALTKHSFHRGEAPDARVVRQLAVGDGVLARGFFQDLVFESADKPLRVSQDSEGYTRLSWELGGWPGDVSEFFDRLHARGKAAGQTLAHLLDVRPDPQTEPTAASLPATINPLAFLSRNILRGSTTLVRLRPSGFGPEAPGLGAADVLRKLVPPNELLILYVVLDGGESAITIEGEESARTSLGHRHEDAVDTSFVGEQVRFRQVGGRCI